MRRLAVLLSFAALLLLVPAHALAQGDDGGCSGRVSDPRPGTPEWTARDAQNQVCAEQRAQDTAAEAVLVGENPVPLRDSRRDPRTLKGAWRYDTATVTNRNGNALATEVFRPAATAPAPYPAVVIVHGGASAKELHWWASEALAESGYLVVAFDVAENTGGDHATDAQDVVDWLLGDAFPFKGDLDPDRVGIAGHSQGASTASLLGQLDRRLKAVVAWDNLTALAPELWEDDLGVDPPPSDAVPWHAPALGIAADYYFVPRPFTAPPEPATSNGEGGRGRGFSAHPKDLGFQEVKARGLDTALFVLRAGTHLDWTPTTTSPSSRYGEAVSTYLTRAWFDRYLKGLDDPALQRDAHRRLVGVTAFDASADLTGARRPLAGRSVCDRMSFFFRSRFAVRPPGGGPPATSEDWRSDCYAGRTVATPAAGPTAKDRRSRRTLTVTVRGLRGVTVRRVIATARGATVGRAKGREVVVRLEGQPCGPVTVRLTIDGRRKDGRAVRTTQRRTFRLCGAGR